ncbi:MAG: GNAT family acetyltransferase [Lachnospiraceae bacterium]|jgi:hypothetical protein|nr:GNAT family acetyltransferase [Lachnospiraceae bacterium]
MIDLHGQISMAFLKKSRFTGSYQGMRYLLQKTERVVEKSGDGQQEERENVLEAVIWPEPYNYEMTKEEKKHSQDFPFCQEGLWEAVDWLNREFEAGNF